MTLEAERSAVTRVRVASTEPDEVRAMMAQTFAVGLTVERPGGAPFAFEQESASDGTTTVSTLRFAGRVSAAMDGAREVLFTDIAEGDYRWRSRARSGDHTRPLVLPADHELAVEFEAVRSALVAVDRVTVERWLLRYGGLPPSQTLLRHATAGSIAVRQAVRTMAEMAKTDAFESALVRAGLLDLLLSTTAHHLLADAPARADRAPAALVRAEEYLRAHAGEAVSMADAAAAARLSIRGLHDQFRRGLDMTPGQYLRNVRLERVRADLIAARDGARTTTVAEVARRWGFAHAGRFSSTYAEAFGEQPSATLRGPSGV